MEGRGTGRSRVNVTLMALTLLLATSVVGGCWRRAPLEPHVAHVSETSFSIAPGGSVAVGIILDGLTSGPMTVSLNVSGATDHFEVGPSPESVEVGAGQSSATVTVEAKDAAPPGASLTIAITPGAHYVVGSPSTTTITVSPP